MLIESTLNQRLFLRYPLHRQTSLRDILALSFLIAVAHDGAGMSLCRFAFFLHLKGPLLEVM
jgi:hypothetical protein